MCYKSVGDAIDTLKRCQNSAPTIRGTKIRVELFSDAVRVLPYEALLNIGLINTLFVGFEKIPPYYP